MMLRLLRTGWLVRGREVNSNIHPSARLDGYKLTLGEDTLETSAVSHALTCTQHRYPASSSVVPPQMSRASVTQMILVGFILHRRINMMRAPPENMSIRAGWSNMVWFTVFRYYSCKSVFWTPLSFVEKWGWRNRSLLLGEHSQGKFSANGEASPQFSGVQTNLLKHLKIWVY